MAKLFKIFIVLAITIIILLGTGIFLLTHYVDPNKFKGSISTIVYRHTGHQLTINGNLSWSFFPWIGFKVTDAKLASNASFGDTPLAKISEADISIRLLPLFLGKVEAGRVKLNNLQINLIRNVKGHTNWKVTNAAIKGVNVKHTNKVNTVYSKHSSAKKNPLTLDFSIANLTVVNSNIHWVDQTKQQSYQLSNLYINGRNIGKQQSFPLTISFNLTSNKLAKPIAASFSGYFTIDDKLDAVAIHQLAVNINNFRLAANLAVKNLKGDTNFQGNINIPAFNLRKFLSIFNISLAKMKNTHALEKLSATMTFNGRDHHLSIKPLTLVLDNTTINGNINISDFEQRRFNFKLNANAIDIDNYLLQKTGKKNKISASVSNHQALPTTTQHTHITAKQKVKKIDLPTQLLRHLNMQGAITIHQLVVANLQLSKAQFKVKANDGILDIAPFSANLYQGSVSGKSRLNLQTTNPRYQLTIKINDVQAQPLLADLIDKKFISGTANFSANLFSDGNTINALINGLQGNGQFSFTNGVLNGLNVDYQLARANALLNQKTMPNKPKRNTTTFGKVTGSMQLNHGVVMNNDLQMTNKKFTGTGSGRINLNTASIDYKLGIKPKGGALQAYFIPLKISGMLSSPSIQLDSDDLLQQVFQTQRQRLVKQAKQHLQKALGDLFAR